MLKEIGKINKLVERETEELEKLRATAEKVTQTLGSIDSSGGSGDRVGMCVAKIVDLEEKITSHIAELIDVQERVLKTIYSLEDLDMQNVLIGRYIQRKKLAELTEEMNFKSVRGLEKFLRKSEKEFKKYF